MLSKFRIHIIASTRPDFIRLARFIKLCKAHPDIECTFIATGQHYDKELYGQFFEELNIPRPDKVLELKQETVNKQTAALISQLDDLLISLQDKPDVAVFLGDVNGVLGSIAYQKYDVPVAHIESGGRSFSALQPEEKNRRIIDQLSSRLYCYHQDYLVNLIREGIAPSNVVVVGNIICDALEDFAPQIKERRLLVREKYNLPPRFFLMTMHRHENVEDSHKAARILGDVNHLAGIHGVKVLLPVMPRLKEIIRGNESVLNNFLLQDPLGFLDFVALEMEAELVLSDSGTVQEECVIFGKRAIILREYTERPHCNSATVRLAVDRFDVVYEDMLAVEPTAVLLGDGRTSERILNDLIENKDKLNNSLDSLVNQWVARCQI